VAQSYRDREMVSQLQDEKDNTFSSCFFFAQKEASGWELFMSEEERNDEET